MIFQNYGYQEENYGGETNCSKEYPKLAQRQVFTAQTILQREYHCRHAQQHRTRPRKSEVYTLSKIANALETPICSLFQPYGAKAEQPYLLLLLEHQLKQKRNARKPSITENIGPQEE